MKTFATPTRNLFAAVVLMALAWAAGAQQAFPNKPIRLLTPYAPGGSTDVVSRIVAPELAKLLGVSVVVENMAGANGNIALSYLTRAPADGHTVLITSTSPIVINPHTYPNAPHDALRDFTPISLVANTESAIVVNPAVPATNLKELIDLSKQRPVFFGISGLGGQPEMIIRKINKDTGAKFELVPFAGGGPAITGALGGHVDVVLNDVGSSLVPMLATGKLRGLVVLDPKDKSEFLPGTTTSSAQGFPRYVSYSWLFLLGPPGMPAQTAERLRKAMADVLAQEDIAQKFKTNALIPAPSRSAGEAREFISQQNDFFRTMQRETGVRVTQ